MIVITKKCREQLSCLYSQLSIGKSEEKKPIIESVLGHCVGPVLTTKEAYKGFENFSAKDMLYCFLKHEKYIGGVAKRPDQRFERMKPGG